MGHHPEIYSREYYQRIADLEDRHWWHVGMREIATGLLRSQDRGRRPSRVLDAGCGTGTGIKWVREVLGAHDVVGADISGEALELCRVRHPGRPLVRASVAELPFRSGCFDLLLCHDVLQHLPTDGLDRRALAEMFRVLRPGGLLLLRANSRLGMGQDEGARDADFQRYTLPEVVSRLAAAGFVVKRATYANFLPALYASLKRRLRRSGKRGHNHHPQRVYEGLGVRDTASRHPWVNRLLILALRAEACYLAAPKRALAFGHSTLCIGAKPVAER